MLKIIYLVTNNYGHSIAFYDKAKAEKYIAYMCEINKDFNIKTDYKIEHITIE